MFESKEQEISVMRHYCKVCNRGFGCAGALGGHMRAHVMGDVSYNNGNESFTVKSHRGNDNNNNNNNNKQHPYFLRAKTPRSFLSYQTTDDLIQDGENKKTSSYKHPKISSSLTSSPPSPRSKSEYFDERHSNSSEEEDLANCLVMLSNKSYALPPDKEETNKAKEVEKGMFQCKACKKFFNSHQALGGHRASHKKVKGCFAAKTNGTMDEENMDGDSVPEDDIDYSTPSDLSESTLKKPKIHECSVCRRVFSSGQALGGHKRCHWLTTSTDNAFIPNFHYDQSQEIYKKPLYIKNDHDIYPRLKLDLGLNLLDPQQWLSNAHHNSQKLENVVVENNGEKACEIKLKKMSDLTDLNMDGEWLQVGIPSNAGTY